MAPFLNLQGIEPFSLHNFDLATWYSRPEDPSWPIAKGRTYREPDGSLTVKLDAEDKLEWKYLQQHLPGDPVWAAIDIWEEAMAQALSGGLSLLETTIQHIQRPPEEGGLGLPVDLKMPYWGGDKPAVGLAYAFALYDQVISRSLGLNHGSITRGAFAFIGGLEGTNTLQLANGPAIKYSDEGQREEAIEFFLKAQGEWVALPEARAAAEAYRKADQATGEVKGHIDRLRLAVAFPPGSVCDACRE